MNGTRLLYGNARAVKPKITFTFKQKFMPRDNFKIEIPEIANTKMKLFVNDEYVGDVTTEQSSQIRVDVCEYINKTNDTSILDTFYFIGHKDSDCEMGEEIKITMDKYGNLSDTAWEIAHVRRSMLKLLQLSQLSPNIIKTQNIWTAVQ